MSPYGYEQLSQSALRDGELGSESGSPSRFRLLYWPPSTPEFACVATTTTSSGVTNSRVLSSPLRPTEQGDCEAGRMGRLSGKWAL